MRLKRKHISNVPVLLEKHQPERRSGGVGGNLYCCGGCCCCCCCVHTLAGLIGATAASVSGKSQSEGSVARYYWGWVALLTVALAFYILATVPSGEETLEFAFALLLFPFLQLLASFLTFLCIAIGKAAFPDKKASFRMLGKITFWSFFWAAAGAIVMFYTFKASR